MKQFNKICMQGQGKGRIELAGSKYTFGYESAINRAKNVLDLVLDFPIVGETIVSLSLNPSEVSRNIDQIDLLTLLKDKIGDRSDGPLIIKTVEEFFVFASDFSRHKALKIYPTHFKAEVSNDHFIMSRETASYIFMVDNFSENESFFERSVFKIFNKSQSTSSPTMLLFLVPQSCDQ